MKKKYISPKLNFYIIEFENGIAVGSTEYTPTEPVTIEEDAEISGTIDWDNL